MVVLRDSGYTAQSDFPINLIVPPVSVASVTAQSSIYLTESKPVSAVLQGIPGLGAAWSLTTAAGTFTPATGAVVFDSNGNATVNATYTAPGIGPGPFTHLVSVMGPGNSAGAGMPMSIDQPTASIVSTGAPTGLKLSQIGPVAITNTGTVAVTLSGTPGFTAQWTLTAAANGGSFTPASGTVTFDSGGNASISPSPMYTASSTAGTGTSVMYTHTLGILTPWTPTPTTQDIPIILAVPQAGVSSTPFPATLNVYLTQSTPVTATLTGEPGYSANWTLSTAAGGTFAPSTGPVTFDSSGLATVSSTYTAPNTGDGEALYSLSVAGQWNTALANVAVNLLAPTVTIASVFVPRVNPNTMAPVTATINLTGSPNFQVNCSLAATAGSFGAITGCPLTLDGIGIGSFSSVYTMTAGTIFGSYLQTATLTLPPTTVSTSPTFFITKSNGVALFANTAYVDYIPNTTGSEASNLGSTLTSQGFAVTPFTGITVADFATVLQDKTFLMLPEMEVSSLGTALLADSAAMNTIVAWVNGGGILVVFAPYDANGIPWLNTAFGLSLAPVVGGAGGAIGVDAAGTPFAAGPVTLPANSATLALPTPLPVGSKVLYADTTAPANAVVALIPAGSGRIVFMGWDWFEAAPTGTQDGGWLQVLQTLVTAAEGGMLQ